MLIVRFPTGMTITYNDANFLSRDATGWVLYTKPPLDGGKWVASISPQSGCVVEAVRACKVENPLTGLTQDAALDMVLSGLREYNGRHLRKLRQLKNDLGSYDARRGDWKR